MLIFGIANFERKPAIDFLRKRFGQDGNRVWETDKLTIATFHHEQFAFSAKSLHLISITLEYKHASESGTFTIYASENKDEEPRSAVENQIAKIIKDSIVTTGPSEVPDVMGNRRYCAKCEKWDDYDIRSGQSVVICKTCGLSISLEEN